MIRHARAAAQTALPWTFRYPRARMTVRVVKVKRDEKLTWASRSYASMLFRGLRGSLHALRGARAALTRRRYPDSAAPLAPGFRGAPVLVSDAGVPRCVGCQRCESSCPAKCIAVTPGPELEGGPPDRFDLDMARCMFCGLCAEVCPEGAIVMSDVFALAGLSRRETAYEMEELLVPASALADRIASAGQRNTEGEPS